MKTKPKKLALWTQLPTAKKRLEAAAASRLSAKAKLLADRRGKVADKAEKRRLERLTYKAVWPKHSFPSNWQHGEGYAKPKPRKRIRPVSKRKAAERKLYVANRDAYLSTHKVCWGCFKPSRLELHHVRGRLGPLLLDERYWMALCPECHRWVHENIEAARKRNLIAAAGDWNKV